MYLHVYMQKCREIIHVHQKCGKHYDLANSVMPPYFFIYANRNKAEPREVTKQVVWIILRHRIFHETFRHIRSGFPSYARTVCVLTLLAYALKSAIRQRKRLFKKAKRLNTANAWNKFKLKRNQVTTLLREQKKYTLKD